MRGNSREQQHLDHRLQCAERREQPQPSRHGRVVLTDHDRDHRSDGERAQTQGEADAPDEYKTYLHRSGRTARAGNSGIAIAFCADDERPYLKDIEKQPAQGGHTLGNLGPVSEGLFVWTFGIGLCIAVAVWLGRKAA